MRIDKFLKVSRLIKRRTVAKEACDNDRVKVNGKPQKASFKLNIGDIIEIELGNSTLKVKVVEMREHVLKDEATELYEVVA